MKFQAYKKRKDFQLAVRDFFGKVATVSTTFCGLKEKPKAGNAFFWPI